MLAEVKNEALVKQEHEKLQKLIQQEAAAKKYYLEGGAMPHLDGAPASPEKKEKTPHDASPYPPVENVRQHVDGDEDFM